MVVFILVGTMLWAFLSAGGADTIAVGVMALYGVVGLAVVEECWPPDPAAEGN